MDASHGRHLLVSDYFSTEELTLLCPVGFALSFHLGTRCCENLCVSVDSSTSPLVSYSGFLPFSWPSFLVCWFCLLFVLYFARRGTPSSALLFQAYRRRLIKKNLLRKIRLHIVHLSAASLLSIRVPRPRKHPRVSRVALSARTC